MATPTVPIASVSATTLSIDAASARIRTWRERSLAESPDAIWVAAVSVMLILVVGALSLQTRQPWLFAGLGPTALMVASSPGHPTTRVQNIVLGHFTGFACAWLAVVLLGVNGSVTSFGARGIPVDRVWASALAVGLTALLQPSLRAYHPPAAATAILVTLGVYRPTWKAFLSIMAGVVVVALLGAWFQRIRLKKHRNTAGPDIPEDRAATTFPMAHRHPGDERPLRSL